MSISEEKQLQKMNKRLQTVFILQLMMCSLLSLLYWENKFWLLTDLLFGNEKKDWIILFSDYSVSVHVVLKLGSRNMFVIIMIIAICEQLIYMIEMIFYCDLSYLDPTGKIHTYFSLSHTLDCFCLFVCMYIK
jgi:hypothetical protein